MANTQVKFNKRFKNLAALYFYFISVSSHFPGHELEQTKCKCSRGLLPRVTILPEWLRHFNDLAVEETAAPACFSRENAEGAGMPPSRLGRIIEMTSHLDAGVKRGGTPREYVRLEDLQN